jgi:energy-coupling factor transport system permease protein
MAFVLQMLEMGKRKSWFHRLNPNAKLLWWICLIIVPILVTNPLVLLAMTIWVWLMAIGANIGKQMYKFLIVSYPIMVGFIVITWPFFYAATPGQHYLFNWTIFHFSLEGFIYALAMGMRIVLALTACTFFVMTTDLMDLASSLGEFMQNRLRISYMYPLMVISSFKFLPELSGDYITILDAFKSRALDMETGSFMVRFKKVVPVAIPLIDSMLRRAQNIAIALELKAFNTANKSRTFYKHHDLRSQDVLFILTGILVIVICIVLNLLHWGKVDIFL